MPSTTTRRQFLGRGAGALGILALGGRPGPSRADDAPSAEALSRKAVAFLRRRQEADGSWSKDRNEPGITALVVTAMLRSGLVTRADEPVVKGLAYLEKFVGPEGGL
jgi:squalene-hopene/tetraprenyl-beta-curcumene cyclase